MSARTRQSAATSANGAGPAGGDARELEWQLAAPDPGEVERWLDRHPLLDGLAIEPLPAQQLHDTYLDTDDWRVFRAGFALRLREKDGQVEATLKGLRSARDDAADRREISEPLRIGAARVGGARALAGAGGPVGTRVRDIAGVKPLRTLFEVRTSRRRFSVRGRKPAAAVGEIALDEARFPRADGHRRPVVLTRVEVEAAVGGDAAALQRLVERLRSECDLHAATENKFAVGLRSASLEPPRLEAERKAQAVQAAIDASTRAGDFAAAALLRLAREWQAHEPAARLGESAEALHALRVTGRRMDTVLSLLGAYLPTALVKTRPRLKSLLDALGAVRDVDIRLEATGGYRDSLPEGDRAALAPLLRHLAAERGAARATMLRALDAKAARHWLDSLPARLAANGWRASAASPRNAAALSVLPKLIRKRYRKLRRRARRLTSDSPLAAYHEVRIGAKKLRYALEIFAPTYAKPAQDMIGALHKLQNKLGAQQDAGAVAEYLRQLAGRAPASFPPQTLFLMGRMAEQHWRQAARLSRKFGRPWRKVRGKRWQALHSRMLALRPSAPPGKSKANGIDHGTGGKWRLAGAAGEPRSAHASRH